MHSAREGFFRRGPKSSLSAGLRRPHSASYAVTARQSPSLPLVGRGWGWGSCIGAPPCQNLPTPTPTLPHKGADAAAPSPHKLTPMGVGGGGEAHLCHNLPPPTPTLPQPKPRIRGFGNSRFRWGEGEAAARP